MKTHDREANTVRDIAVSASKRYCRLWYPLSSLFSASVVIVLSFIMSIWTHDENTCNTPWEIFTGLRYDPILRMSNDTQQLRPDGQRSAFYLCEYHRQRLVEAAGYFGWRNNINAASLSDLSAWEETLTKAVTEYQGASSSLGITIDTPLKVRIALVNPDIIQECHNNVGGIIDSAGQSMKDYGRKIQNDPRVLSTGLHISIVPVPVQPLSQLFPLTLDLSSEARSLLTHQFLVVIDTVATGASSWTYFKTFPRAVYDSASARMSMLLAANEQNSQHDGNNKVVDHQHNTNGHPTLSRHQMKDVVLFNESDNITEGSFTNIYFYREGRWVTPPVGIDHGGLAGTARRWALETGLCAEQAVPRSSVKINEEVWLSNGVRGFMPGIIVSVEQ